MVIKTTGIVLKQRNMGENPDRIITILTADSGIIEATMRGMRSVRNNPLMAVGVLGYYEFSVFKGKNMNYINAAEIIESFYNIRMDVEKLALSGYFCELICSLEPGFKDSSENLRLLLNTLHFINTSKKELKLLKSIYELRAVSMAGFMPDMTGCRSCGEYESEETIFYPLDGFIECRNCCNIHITKDKRNGNTPCYILTPPLLSAVRHILYSEMDKLFRFSISDDILINLNILSEYYTLIHTEIKSNSLEMFKSLSL